MNENECVWDYPTTLAAWTLIILFSKLLKISKIISFQKKLNLVKEKHWIFIVEMKISKLNNYYTDMCWSCQGTMVLARPMVGNLLPPLFKLFINSLFLTFCKFHVVFPGVFGGHFIHINITSKCHNAPTTGHIHLPCAYKRLLLGPLPQEGPPWGPYLTLQLTSSDLQCELVLFLTHGCRVACPMTCWKK
jgi:hypothetical protein